MAVRWLRVYEGQLFATVLHQSQQEVTMVPVTDSVATCWSRGIGPPGHAPMPLYPLVPVASFITPAGPSASGG